MLIPVAYITNYGGNPIGCVAYNTDTHKFNDTDISLAKGAILPIQDYLSCEVKGLYATIVGKNYKEYVCCFGDNMLYSLSKEQLSHYKLTNVKITKDNRLICRQGKMQDLSYLFPDKRIQFVRLSRELQNSSIGIAKKFYAKFNGKDCLIKFSKGNENDLINEVLYYKVGKILNIRVCKAILTQYNGKNCIASIFEYDKKKDSYLSFKNTNKTLGDIRNSFCESDKLEFDKALILDYLLSQQDRHLSNLAIVNGRFYPLFDNGECLGLSPISYFSNRFRQYIERMDNVSKVLSITEQQYREIIKVLKDKSTVFIDNFNKIYNKR